MNRLLRNLARIEHVTKGAYRPTLSAIGKERFRAMCNSPCYPRVAQILTILMMFMYSRLLSFEARTDDNVIQEIRNLTRGRSEIGMPHSFC